MHFKVTQFSQLDGIKPHIEYYPGIVITSKDLNRPHSTNPDYLNDKSNVISCLDATSSKYIWEIEKEVTPFFSKYTLVQRLSLLHLSTFEYMEEQGIDLCSHEGIALIYASDNNLFDVMRFLLDRSILKTLSDSNRKRLISFHSNTNEIINVVVEGGLDPNMLLLDHLTTKFFVGESLAQYLIEKGANDFMFNDSYFKKAIGGHAIGVIEYLCKEGCKVPYIDSVMITSVVTHGILDYLLRNFGNPSEMDLEAAMNHTIHCTYLPAIKYLRENTACKLDLNEITPNQIGRIIEMDALEVIKYFHSEGIDLSRGDYYLLLSIRKYNDGILKFLLENGYGFKGTDHLDEIRRLFWGQRMSTIEIITEFHPELIFKQEHVDYACQNIVSMEILASYLLRNGETYGMRFNEDYFENLCEFADRELIRYVVNSRGYQKTS